MKSKLFTFVVALCIGCLITSGVSAKGKPDKPDKPVNTETEWIEFTGSLSGWQEVEGCCPNAGPFPSYTMTLDFPDTLDLDDTYDGQLFINNYRSGHDRGYIVQFWNDHDALNHVAIEIKGGEVYIDKKTKIVKVVFEDAECRDLHTKEFIAEVSFTLVRTPN